MMFHTKQRHKDALSFTNNNENIEKKYSNLAFYESI